MSRALLGKMAVPSSSPVFSGGFVVPLIWAMACLANGEVTVQPVTTAGYNSTEETHTNVTGNSTVPSACGHKQTIDCGLYCGFCDHEFHGERIDCLALFLTHVCLFTFKNEMEPLNSSDWCIWGKVNRLYSNLSQCTEDMSDCLLIPWPNPLVEQTFVDIHSTYFQECPTEEFNDPPPSVVFALVITPICLIPLMVSLVVLKTKNGDGNS